MIDTRRVPVYCRRSGKRRSSLGSIAIDQPWRQYAVDVRGHVVPGGHFLPEEAPDETYAALRAFFAEA